MRRKRAQKIKNTDYPKGDPRRWEPGLNSIKRVGAKWKRRWHASLLEQATLRARVTGRAPSYLFGYLVAANIIAGAEQFRDYAQRQLNAAHEKLDDGSDVYLPDIITEMESRRDQWLNQMDAQDNKCAECHEELIVDQTAKRGHTYEIICLKCYQKPLGEVNHG